MGPAVPAEKEFHSIFVKLFLERSQDRESVIGVWYFTHLPRFTLRRVFVQEVSFSFNCFQYVFTHARNTGFRFRC